MSVAAGGLPLPKNRTALPLHPMPFRDADVLATDDVFSRNYPNLDWGSGGSINGMINAANVFLKAANDNTKIVTTTNPISTTCSRTPTTLPMQNPFEGVRARRRPHHAQNRQYGSRHCSRPSR
jgi:hypothetical protein